MSEKIIATPRLSSLKLAAFSSLGIPLAGSLLPVAVYLPPFYAQTMGLGLGVVGTVFMLSRLWNAICDPLVGVLSDRTRTPIGRRKPWIAAGAPLVIAAIVAVFWPPVNATASHLGLYLGAWMFVLYLGWAMVGTPFYAWSGELSAQYHQRSRVQTFVQVAVASGYVLVLLIPAILDQMGPQFAHEKVAAMGAFALVSLIPGLVTLLFRFREDPSLSAQHGDTRVAKSLAEVLTSPLVLRVMGSDFFVCFGQGMRTALFVFYVTAYMGLPKWGSLLYLLQFVFGVFAGPIWLRIGYRLGKHRTVIAGEITQIAVNLCLLLMVPGQFWPLIALTIAQGLSQGSGNLMLRAIVSDIADERRLHSGLEQSGLLFSIFNVTSNAAAAAAVGIAYPILAWIGFYPGHANSAAALSGLAMLFALGPAFGHTVSALLIWRFPLDEEAHARTRRALDLRDAASAAAPPPEFIPTALISGVGPIAPQPST
jgi:GPH family glycoside/pentoside/hexuronide:cation symporter